MAINSDATVIVKPSFLSIPLTFDPCPIVISRKDLSFISSARFQIILFGSIFSSFPWYIWLSIIADIKLIADVSAWKSPLKCKLISSDGSTVTFPPPVAPPFNPNTEPIDGSLKTPIAFSPI